MLHRLSIILLVAGLAVSVHPVGSRIKRVWLQWTAAAEWKNCKGAPATGLHGEPTLWLEIPSAGIEQLVVEGVDGANLSRFPGKETVGNATLIMAHRDTHFRGLANIGEGDRIELELHEGRHRQYRIQSIAICDKADAKRYVQAQASEDCLILLTCYPFRYIGHAPQRFIVVAVPA